GVPARLPCPLPSKTSLAVLRHLATGSYVKKCGDSEKCLGFLTTYFYTNLVGTLDSRARGCRTSTTATATHRLAGPLRSRCPGYSRAVAPLCPGSGGCRCSLTPQGRLGVWGVWVVFRRSAPART